MGDLGRAVTRQSLAALGSSRDVLPDLSLWLNVDLLQLRDPSFADMLAEELRASGIDATDIVLELSEADLLDVDEIEASIARLRAMGVRLAVDDFGTGYSSIVRLTELPIDIVKLDRALVAGISDGGDPAVGILSAAVALVSHAGLEIVVEGVETEAELRAVRDLGCTIVQGYLLRRPGPAAEVLAEQAAERRPTRLR
jgi:EAL domain-containing protein (putative c-di-GMP-specific phosphodiesterase class I)